MKRIWFFWLVVVLLLVGYLGWCNLVLGSYLPINHQGIPMPDLNGLTQTKTEEVKDLCAPDIFTYTSTFYVGQYCSYHAYILLFEKKPFAVAVQCEEDPLLIYVDYNRDGWAEYHGKPGSKGIGDSPCDIRKMLQTKI